MLLIEPVNGGGVVIELRSDQEPPILGKSEAPPRGPQPVPSDTPWILPWRLALGFLPRDGPRRQIQAARAAPEGKAFGMLNTIRRAFFLQDKSEARLRRASRTAASSLFPRFDFPLLPT